VIGQNVSANTPRHSRDRFLRLVSRALTEQLIGHVFLHGHSQADADSDIDVAVNPESLDAVDLLVTSGTFGPLIQRVSYDIPWCRSYVVRFDSKQRYEQLDLACDPWGVSRIGPAIQVALSAARKVDGLSVPSPAASAFYLASKRAVKGATHPQAALLIHAFKLDPEGFRDLAADQFGDTGIRVSAHLAQGEVGPALELLGDAIRRHHRTPPVLVRRAVFAPKRVITRVLHPVGLSVSLAGPDGVGKSTLADLLGQATRRAFRGSDRFHLRPGILPPPATLLGRVAPTGDAPHSRNPSGGLVSAGRLLYLLVDTIIGWPSRVWLPRVRAKLVVIERGLADVAVDPTRYRVRLPAVLLKHVTRLAPRATVTLVLRAPPEVIRSRKAELSVPEIERQLHEWQQKAARGPGRFHFIDAEKTTSTLDAAVGAIEDQLVRRQPNFRRARIALACLGGPRDYGVGYRLIGVRGRIRWCIPDGSGVLQSGIYRPATRRHIAAARALDVVARARLSGTRFRIDPKSGIAPLVAEVLGLAAVRLSLALPKDDDRDDRASFAVLDGRRVVAFGKVGSASAELEHEARVLSVLARTELTSIVVPEVLGQIDSRGLFVLLLKPIDIRGRVDRDTERPELDALIELGLLKSRLAAVLGSSGGAFPVHGDFCGWNSARVAGGRLALWDWEGARLGLPLEDLFHWRLQRLLHFGKGDPETLARSALDPDDEVEDLCTRLQADPAVAPDALAACLERGQVAHGTTGVVHSRAESIRRAVWAHLEASCGY
jgi:thymidylate kinase